MMSEEVVKSRCATDGCERPPVARYTWPGREEAVVCRAHAMAALRVAEACGFHLQVRSTGDEE